MSKDRKTKMTLPGTSKRGGKRNPPGGRPKKIRNFSAAVRADVMSELERRQRESGETYGRLLVDLAFDGKAFHSLRGIALKLIAEILVVKESKHKLEKVHDSGVIILPPIAGPESHELLPNAVQKP